VVIAFAAVVAFAVTFAVVLADDLTDVAVVGVKGDFGRTLTIDWVGSSGVLFAGLEGKENVIEESLGCCSRMTDNLDWHG